MIGQTISHYKILEKLGEGGMGVVYKAQDLKLERFVALKFLPHHLSAYEEEKKRFIHEAKAASALDHPNICTIYEIDENEDGRMFIAMAYYEGETLKKKIERGPRPLDEAIKLAIQVAQGLQCAHETSITHRDIKPANIMITNRGEVKIVDFGLAKLAGRTKLTKEGTTLGTVAYMSPEQARGEEADHRTDIWAIGVVLYEMLTGKTPFRGEYDQAVMYSICHEAPEPLTGLRTGVPMELERIVNKCLAKAPSERYQHADELIVDLHRTKKESESKGVPRRTGVGTSIPKMGVHAFVLPGIILGIVILALGAYFWFFGPEEVIAERIPIAIVDFVNETKEDELNGLSGMLITALEQSRRLAVMSRARMYDEFKQMDRPDLTFVDETAGREISKRANISALAVATIRKFGQLYTIDFKVIDPQSGDRLFSTKVEGKGQESIPGLIDQLSEKTRIDLKEQENVIRLASRGVAEVTTVDLEAYQHYFKGEELISKLQFKVAEEELDKAIALDTTFALAYYRLAHARLWDSAERAKEPIQKAIQYLDKAPEKERYLIRALNAQIQGKSDESVTLYRELLRLYPKEKEALFAVGDWSYHNHDYVAAITYLEKVLALDPADERALQHLTFTYMDAGQNDEMLEYAKQYVTKIPTSEEAHALLSRAYAIRSEVAEALQAYQRALELFPKSTRPILGMGGVYIFKEEYQKAEAEFEKLLIASRPLSDRRVGYINLARLYAYLGKYRETIKMIDKAIEINLSLGDKTELAGSYAEKAFWYLVGWNDSDNAKGAMEKGLELKHVGDFWFYIFLFRTYLMMGEYDKALPIANSQLVTSAPFSDEKLRANIHQAKGEYDEAIKEFHMATQAGDPNFVNISIGYDLARCYLEKGQHEKAVEAIRKLQRTYNPSYYYRAEVYPRSFSLLGEIYERQGDKQRAIESYEKFFDLWKDAEADLPDLIDAKARYAKLKGTSEK